jgi:hypothetical protein
MSGMVEHSSQRTQPANASAQVSAAPSTTRVRPSSFKYYIHDSIAVLRFKLIGQLTQSDIAELNGSWRTARTTLGKRKLVLDLQALRTVDEAGKQWLAAMSAEGATYLPENYLVSCIAGQHASDIESDLPAPKATLFRKVASLFRGERVSAARSPKQAQ